MIKLVILYVVSLKSYSYQEPIDKVKWGLTVHPLRKIMSKSIGTASDPYPMVSLGSPAILLSSLQNKLSSWVLLRGIEIGPENFPALFKITVKGGKEWGFPSWNPPVGPCVHFFGFVCENAWFKSSHVRAGVLILSFRTLQLCLLSPSSLSPPLTPTWAWDTDPVSTPPSDLGTWACGFLKQASSSISLRVQSHWEVGTAMRCATPKRLQFVSLLIC